MPDTATEARFGRKIPLDVVNGYYPAARPAVRVPAVEVQPGDILVLDGYVSRVSYVNVRDLARGGDLAVEHPGLSVPEIVAKYAGGPRWPVLHITGDVNIVRGPRELVSVIRQDPSA